LEIGDLTKHPKRKQLHNAFEPLPPRVREARIGRVTQEKSVVLTPVQANIQPAGPKALIISHYGHIPNFRFLRLEN